MKKCRAFIAAGLCIALISGALSLSSFASLMPFSAIFGAPEAEMRTIEESSAEIAADDNITDCFSSETVPVLQGESAEQPAAFAVLTDTDAYSETQAETKKFYGESFGDDDGVSSDQPDTAVCEPVCEPADAAEALPSEPESEPTIKEASAAAPLKAADPMSGVSDIPSLFNRDIKGGLASSADKKSYTFTVTERGVLQYAFTHEKSSFDGVWNVSLYQNYNSNGYDGEEKWRLLNSLDTSASKTVEKSPNVGLQKGEYRIVVSAGQSFSAASYQLNASFTAGTDYEIEYNDSVYRYTEIFPGFPVKGSSGNLKNAYDADYYMFRMTARGTAELVFEHTPIDSVSVYWRVALYDANGTEVYADNSLSSAKKMSSGKIGLDPGCYYVGIFGRVYSDFDYTLTVNTEKRTDFETEPNGTAAAADTLLPNGSITGALTSSSGNADTDVFALTVSMPGTVRLTFTTGSGEETDYCWHMQFTDKNGNKISESRVAPAAPEAKTAEIGVGAGTYYVTVDNRSLHENCADYTVKCEFTESAAWEREYNGTPVSATPVLNNTAVNGTLINCEADFDDDYYKLTLPSNGIINVTLEHEEKQGDRYIYSLALLDASGSSVQLFDEGSGAKLVNGNGTPVTSVKSYENTVSVKAAYLLPAGTYYIRVTSGLYSTDGIYKLTYTVKGG